VVLMVLVVVNLVVVREVVVDIEVVAAVGVAVAPVLVVVDEVEIVLSHSLLSSLHMQFVHVILTESLKGTVEPKGSTPTRRFSISFSTNGVISPLDEVESLHLISKLGLSGKLQTFTASLPSLILYS